MKHEDMIKLANKLNFLAVQAYLLHTGWIKIDSKRDKIGIFRKVKGEYTYEIMLPLSKEFGDYTTQMIKSIKTLAESEDKVFEVLLSDLNLGPFDILRFRVHSKDTEEGTISFDEGYALLANAKKMLYAAACDILQPEKYHKRLSFKSAEQFIDKCRLGQTERGSFIASVVCPFVNENLDEEEPVQLNLFAETEEFVSSFTRKVTTQVMKSVETVKKAIELNKIDEFINGEMEVQVSGNFLESLIALNELNEDSEINIITSWSTAAPWNSNAPTSVSLTKEYVPAIETIINKVRPTITDKPGEYVGKISGVQAEPDTDKREKGDVIFSFLEDDKAVRAKVTLSIEDYNLACEAHKEGKNVKISGILITKGKSKIIDQAVFSAL